MFLLQHAVGFVYAEISSDETFIEEEIITDENLPLSDSPVTGNADSGDEKLAAEKKESKEIPEEENIEKNTEKTNDLSCRYKKIDFSLHSEEGLESGTKLSVTEITESDEDYQKYYEKSLTTVDNFQYIKIYDINLINDGEKIEPDSSVLVNIDLGKELENIKVIHFEGKKEQPKLIEPETDGTELSFKTESFSAYAIIAGPEDPDNGFEQITSIEDITDGPIYISHTLGYFLKNQQYNVSSGRTGILKTSLEEHPQTSASPYYFVSDGNGKYYIYCYSNNGAKQYIKNASNKSLSFTSTPVTAFDVEVSDGIFTIHNGDWYVNMQGGVNGKGFAAYNDAGDVNAKLHFWTYEEPEGDQLGLNGKSYGLMYYDEITAGKAVSVKENTIKPELMEIYASQTDHSDKLYVPKEADIQKWTFEWVDKHNYYVSTIVNDEKKYISLDGNRLALTDVATTVKVDTKNGKIRLTNGSVNFEYSGVFENGFIASTANAYDWLNLVEEREITEEYKTTYTAQKVSVSDTTSVKNGEKLIVYTRIWNTENKKYEIYAIDHDGSLVLCEDDGDNIKWNGSAVNSLLWEFTEYYHEGTTTPNYYYELQNVYSEKYIAPQKNGQILSDNTIGINLAGRRHNDYYSTIVAWDDENYAYAALKTEGTELVSGSITSPTSFYFAIMKDVEADDSINTVNTIDNNLHGITMKMVNFSAPEIQNGVLGSSAGGMNVPPTQGLLSTQTNDRGYPTAKLTGKSLEELFGEAVPVNHLFIADIYNSSGYYEYDSTKNFASLQSDKNFKVYDRLATTDTSSRPSLKHGQFFPYDDIKPGKYSKINPENLYDAELNELPESDTRKYERMFWVDKPDYYFGMELEASFTQTPSGLDNWGHDIIYEFTGDDDFWLYVDGQLVIDLGGIHSALPGKINYSTGEVSVNNRKTTLYQIFKENYQSEHPTATDSETTAYLADIFEQNEKGQWLFKDYTSHTMKLFFMERGAGASNLHMKFNLASVRPGQIILNKQISGTSNRDYRLSEYGYQIYYQTEEGAPFHLLEKTDANYQPTVAYQDSNAEVKYSASYTPAGSAVTYNNVFFLTPAQTVVINVPDDTFKYKIVECGVNTQVYDVVKVNDDEIEGIQVDTNRMDYSTTESRVNERQRVIFDNHVSENAERTLTITKKLLDENDNLIEDDETGFDFRLYLGTENDEEIPAANIQEYHVRDNHGYYCTWDSVNGLFTPTNKIEFEDLTEAEQENATFHTSPNGAISKIPANYKVEVRGLLVGTTFKVEERASEIPEGYKFVRYDREGTSYILHGDAVNSGVIRENDSPAIDIVNRRGYKLTVNKQWSDKDYVKAHEDIFAGVYSGEQLISVKKLNNNTASWYFDTLEGNFEDYEVKEVTPVGEYSIEGDVVTGEFEAVEDGASVMVDVTTKDDQEVRYSYITAHTQGTPQGSAHNIRTDTITNTRDGLRILKQDRSGHALAGAKFTLTDSQGENVGSSEYTSNSNGYVTTAYLEPNETYTLTETEAPRGYFGLEQPITITVSAAGIYTTHGESYTLLQNKELIVKNRPLSFQIMKTDENNIPLENVHFALYDGVMIGGTISPDFRPISGYEDLTTNSEGVFSEINETLPPGTYFLREIETLQGYEPLWQDVKFTIDNLGRITMSGPPGASITKTVSSVTTITINIMNYPLFAAPTGYRKNIIIPILAILAIILLIKARAKR